MKGASIQFRLISAILLTTFVALLVSSVAKVVYNLQDYRERVTREMVTQANILGRAVTPALQFNDVDSARRYLELFESNESIMAAAIYNERGVLFADYKLSDESKRSFSGVGSNVASVEGDSLIYFTQINANNEIIGFVFVRMRYDFFSNLYGNLAISAVVMIVALLVSLLFSVRLQRSITEPLKSIVQLSKTLVETKNYSLRAEGDVGGEIGALVDAYNEMLDEVEERKKQLEVFNKELASEIQERLEAEQALKESEEKIMLLNAHLEQRVRERTMQLEETNKELEAFSYSVSHDLRTPLRAIDGFSLALLEDYNDKLDEEGQDCLARVRQAAQRMGELIDDLLKLSRVTRADMSVQEVDLSKLAEKILEDIWGEDEGREAKIHVTSGLHAICDPHLIKIALINLFGNAWKYSSKKPFTKIEFGLRQYDGEPVFFVEDNGVGFDMAYVEKLFGAFQRLHSAADFPGSGIGLATVKRIISRHRGRIWAESSPGNGTTFYFTLPPPETDIDQINGEEDDEYTANLAGGR